MSDHPPTTLRQDVYPLLRSAFLSGADAPKNPTDDLMLALCDKLLTLSPERARAFYLNPLEKAEHEDSWFNRVVLEDLHVLFRQYRRRAAWLSLEEQSAPRLRSGLFAFALSETHVGDWRDLLVSLAPYHHCAQKLAMDIPRLFDQVTPYALPDAAPYFETFGRRTDVTLGVFGWREIDTPYGKRIHSP